MKLSQRITISSVMIGALFSFCHTASARDEFELCVMGQMQGQNMNMLRLAQKICRDLYPPPPVDPVETDVTKLIDYRACSKEGEKLSVCLYKIPDNIIISRVVGYLANRDPCVINEQGPYPNLYKTNMKRVSADMYFVVARPAWLTADEYVFGLKPEVFNCYSVAILGYVNCRRTWTRDLSCH